MEEANETVARDARLVLGLVVATAVSLTLLAAVAFIAGFPALHAAAREWLGLPGLVALLYPIGVDIGIIVFSLASLAGRALRLRVWPMAAGVGFLVVMSAGLQVAHVLSLGHGDLIPAVAGSVAGACLPGLLWLAANSLERVLFSPAVDRAAGKKRKLAARRVMKPAVAPAQKIAAQVAPKIGAKPAAAVAGKMPKRAAKELAAELHRKNASLSEISRRTGYSRPAITAWVEAA